MDREKQRQGGLVEQFPFGETGRVSRPRGLERKRKALKLLKGNIGTGRRV